MLEKLFVTDCEGPLSLNDNAYELAKEFIPEGDEFFRILSLFDDYLVDVVKKEDYNPGNTLKLIVPFFKVYGLTIEDILNFSKENVFFVDGAINTMNLAKRSMDSFIVSTSYGQYIEAVCDNLDFPFENTYYTSLESYDSFESSDTEIEKLLELKEIISQIAKNEKEGSTLDVDKLNEIFFEEIPKMNIAKLVDSVVCVGGAGKQIAVEDILAKHNLEKKGLMYVGDSHTDVEPLRFAKKNGGLAVSFNGNETSVKEAEIAIISENTIATSLLIDIHSRFNKEYLLEFVKAYCDNVKRAFEGFRLNFPVIDEFNEIFKDKELPIIKIITNDNIEELTEKSIEMRKKVRGASIGSLG